MITTKFLSPLHETVSTTPTDLWNDSCSIEELTYSIAHGAAGATTNPTIVLAVLKKEIATWRGRIQEIIQQNPVWSEEEIAWRIVETMGVKAAALLRPVFEREKGRKGRLSMQTNPMFYRNPAAILEQGLRFHSLAPNIQVKAPVTNAGVQAIEEATYRGVSINATVCFTVPQAIAVAEAVERGLARRGDSAGITPVCTIMVGRLDDWLKVIAARDKICLTPGHLDWAGIAVIKKAYQLFQQRGYRTRLLAAAFRHHMHWSELIGGDLILTIPHQWQLLFNSSDIEVRPRMQDPVDPRIVDELYRKFPDFRAAYDVDGMSVEQFDQFGATIRTLRTFIESYIDLLGFVRDFMLPNPDRNPGG